MAGVRLNNVCKFYEVKSQKRTKGLWREKQIFKAVDNFSMDIDDNEFIVFVGPSGCGKSTTLRMIAGLEEITSGEIYIGDKLVNDVEPMERDIAMVFQNYALYPHMTVYDNIAFGLKFRKIPVEKTDKEGNKVLGIDKKKIKSLEKKIKGYQKTLSALGEDEDSTVIAAEKEKAEKELEYYKTTPVQQYVYKRIPKSEIKATVMEVASILDIEGQLNKKPQEMSGGQRQRVALGRAMVRKPKVFLLDEPLSNLDAKLRAAMRVEISKLHKKIGTTFIYVTHDQVEAMTMGTRIVVMKQGVIQQIDTPNNLFDYPANKFVAGFIGTPQMNFFDGTLKKEGKNIVLTLADGQAQSFPQTAFNPIEESYLDGESHEVIIGVRGENMIIGGEGISLNVNLVEAMGNESYVYASLPETDKEKIDGNDAIIKIAGRCGLLAGESIKVGFEEGKIHLFDKQTEQSVCTRPQ